jgi:hypothetical protein
MTRALALRCCAVSLLLSLFLVHTASAKPKVALTQIEGDATGDVRDAVAEALEGKELSLIGSREVNRAVDKLGDLADLTEKDFKKLASELDADAIVAGKLDRVGTAKTLKFRLFVKKKMAKGFTVSFKDAKSEKFRTMLHDKMLDKIGATGDDEDARPARKKKAADDEEDPLATKKDKKDKKVARKAEDEEADARPAKKDKKVAKKGDDEEAEPRPAKKAKAAVAEDEDARPAKKAKAAAADDDARPAKKASDDDARPSDDEARPARKAADDDEAPRKAKKKVAAADDGDEVEGGLVATAEPRRGANRVAARVDFGASVVQHTFKFNSTKFANQPKNLAIAPVPGARLEGELYPLAVSSPRGPLAGLGIGFDYDKTLRLNLLASDPNAGMGTSITVAAKQSHYSIGLRYRLVFGGTETSPSVTLGVGYGRRLFSTPLPPMATDVERAAIRRDTPETDYKIVDPGLTFRLPVTRMVAFTAGGRGLVVADAGPIVKATSYGRAKVYGVDATVALDVVLGSHFALRFAGEYTQIGFSFLGGTNTLANTLDGDPTHQDVGGLADRSLGGTATLAVLY